MKDIKFKGNWSIIAFAIEKFKTVDLDKREWKYHSAKSQRLVELLPRSRSIAYILDRLINTAYLNIFLG